MKVAEFPLLWRQLLLHSCRTARTFEAHICFVASVVVRVVWSLLTSDVKHSGKSALNLSRSHADILPSISVFSPQYLIFSAILLLSVFNFFPLCLLCAPCLIFSLIFYFFSQLCLFSLCIRFFKSVFTFLPVYLIFPSMFEFSLCSLTFPSKFDIFSSYSIPPYLFFPSYLIFSLSIPFYNPIFFLSCIFNFSLHIRFFSAHSILSLHIRFISTSTIHVSLHTVFVSCCTSALVELRVS